MKKLPLLSAALCCSVCSFAQPVLTQDNCAPEAGTFYERTSVPYILLPGPDGPNVTWDLSSILTSVTYSYLYEPAENATYSSNFPEATLVRSEINQGNVTREEFYAISADRWDFNGVALSPSTYTIHSDPFLVMSFPFTYQNACEDTAVSSGQDINGTPFSSTSEIAITADAYGTLLLPDGLVLDSVVRIAAHRFTESNGSITTESFVYEWYKPGIRDVIMRYYTFTNDGTNWYQTAYAQTNASILGTSNLKQTHAIVTPNPITGTGKILLPDGDKTIRILAADGSLAKEITGYNGNELLLDRNDFEPGMYFYSISDQNGMQANGKIVFI